MKNKTGFTLIELLVVVLIMGILASIALPQYQQAVAKARYIKLMPMVQALKDAEEEYWLIHRRYAYDFDELGFKISGFGNKDSTGSAPTRRSTISTEDGQMKLKLDENGGGDPCVWGILEVGGKQVSYLMYLDKAGYRYPRFCYSNTRTTNDWRYKLCASLTGSSSPQAGFEGSPRFAFVK